MTRQALVAILGIFMVFGSFAAPATAAGWSDSAYYDQARYGRGHGHANGGLFHFGPTTSKIAKIGLTATGSVLAGLFGSQFGTIGTVVGGAAGFFVSKWIGDKLFGANAYPQQYNEGGGNWFTRIKDKILGRDKGPYPPVYGAPGYGAAAGGNRWSKISPLNNGNLADSRQAFYRAMEDYQRALTSGSQAEKEAAKASYDAARNAFFSAKGN